MKQLTTEQLKQYLANPLGMDEAVRSWCKLPDTKYFSVSVWPEERAGVVTVTSVGRVVTAKKISKSDQK